MKDEHEIRLEECSYFNSAHRYADGFSYLRCSCGWDAGAQKASRCTLLFMAHVQQAIAKKANQ